MDQQRPVSCRPSKGVPLRLYIMPEAPLSPPGYEFVPGRDHHTEAMDQRSPTDDNGNSPSRPRNVDGRDCHQGGYTAPASIPVAAPHHDIERASSSRASSQARSSPFTTPAGSPASVGENTYHKNLSQGHVQRNASVGPPANAPKGPSGRQQQSSCSATRQNGPPPNAPTGPAAMRIQDQRRKKRQPQQEPTYLASGQVSYSMTWKSDAKELHEDFEKYNNFMNIMGVKNESRAPNFQQYIFLRSSCSNRNFRLMNRKEAARNATRQRRATKRKTDMERDEEIRKLREAKLARRDLFTPFFVEMWWDRAVPAVGGSIWPSVPDQKRVGDGNKSRNSPRSLCSPPENKAEQDGVDANTRDKSANYFLGPTQKAISEEESLEMSIGDPEPSRESWYPRELIDFIDEDTDRKIQEESENKERQLQEKENESGDEEAWRKYLVE